jgi:hypothetical protein
MRFMSFFIFPASTRSHRNINRNRDKSKTRFGLKQGFADDS